MQVEFLQSVLEDLLEIEEYIARDNPRRALTFVEELEQAALRIGENPFAYRLRPDIGKNVRAAVFHDYMILFRILGDLVLIGRIVHGARNLPKLP